MFTLFFCLLFAKEDNEPVNIKTSPPEEVYSFVILLIYLQAFREMVILTAV